MGKQVKIDKDELEYLQSIAGAADTAFSPGNCSNCREEALDYLSYVFSDEPVASGAAVA